MNAITITKDIRSWVSILFLGGVLALGAVGLISQPASAQAQAGLRLTNSGEPISLVATPGTAATTDISIRNSGTQPETLKAGLMKFGARGDEGKPALSDREPGDDYFDWVTLTPSEFTIAPNESKTIRMTVNVPKEAAFGYYYAVTFSRASDPKPVKGQQVKGAIATLVLLEAKVPGAKRELQVESFSSNEGIYEFLPATFNVRIKNTGNVHAIPKGDLSITQGNTELERMGINPQNSYILPGSSRSFTLKWDDGFPRHVPKVVDGKVVTNDKGEPEQDFQIDWANSSKFRFGQYSANLLMVYDDGQRDVPIEKSTQFHVWPWKLMLIVGAIVLLVVIAIVTDLIKLEHFLLRKKGSKNKPAAKPAKKAVAKKPVARKPAAKPATSKKAPVSRKKK